MPYITTERVKEIRKQLNAALPEYKLSVTREHYSSLRIAVMAGPIDMCPGEEKKYEQCNRYYLESHYEHTPEIYAVLKKISDIATADIRIVSEDGDYGSIPNYYVDIHIGKWDKPYQVNAIQILQTSNS